MPKFEELTGVFDFERNVFGRDEDRTIIGSLEDGKIIKGRAAEGVLETGLTYRWYGYWTEHPKYGKQFAFQSFTEALPSGQRGTVAYLCRCRGIGKKRAFAIWEHWGPQAVAVLKANPAEVAARIKGLTEEAAEEAAAYFRRIEALEAVTIELTELLGNRGFPRRLIQALIEKMGNLAPLAIRENPYVLMAFKGVGFLRADQLYLELGKDVGAIERQARCAWHAIHSDQEGHTWYTIQACRAAINRNVAGTTPDHEAAIRWAVENDLLAVHDGEWVAERTKANDECRLAGYVREVEVESECVI